MPARISPRLSLWSWVLYDLANTVYAATLTYLFAPYFTERYPTYRGALGGVHTASMVLAGLLIPWLGALADRTGRAHRYLGLATGAAVLGTAGFAAADGVGLLAFFFCANLGYQAALVFYNTLLVSVAPAGRLGRTSGLGVGVGYVGTILTLLALLPMVSHPALGYRGAFLGAALLFALGALPCLLFVRDRRVRPTAIVTGPLLRRALRGLARQRPLRLFLVANFCLVDVLNTAILFFADYTREVFRPQYRAGELTLFGLRFSPAGDPELRMVPFLLVLGLALNLVAFGAGLVLGRLADRRPPLQVVQFSAWALVAALVGGVLWGGRSGTGYLLTLVLWGAVGLAGLWTAGRKVVAELAPPAELGLYYGLYGLTLKLSVLGATTFGVLADAAGVKTALLAQSLFLAVGLVFLHAARAASGRRAKAP